MKSTLVPLEGDQGRNLVKLTVEVDESEFDKDIDSAFRKIAREVRIPGFRPGKAPRRVLEARIGVAPAREFGPLSLKAIRQLMVENDLCRAIINQRIGRLRRVFKWAASEELIPFDVYHRLTTVAGLQRGRSKVRDAEPVEPVENERVDATLPYLNRHVRGLIAFQRLTGCRPGEACRVRRADIDTGGAVWVYRPIQHKNAWRGKPEASR